MAAQSASALAGETGAGLVHGLKLVAVALVAQAVPGPLFTFAAFLGAAQSGTPSGIPGGLMALLAVFLPGILLIYGMLPFWDALRRHPAARAGLLGVNAALVLWRVPAWLVVAVTSMAGLAAAAL